MTKDKIDTNLRSVHVDNYLVRWGLRPKGKGELVYQKFVWAFSIFMMIYWSIIISIHLFNLDEKYSILLCDFTRFVNHYPSKLFYHINILLTAIISVSWTTYCLNIRENNKYFYWMKLFDMIKGKKHAKELYLTEYMANEVWRETYWTMNTIYTVIRNVAMITATSVIIYSNWNEILNLHINALIWTPLQALWVYYMSSHTIGPLAIFRCICFYFDIRLLKLIEDAKIICRHANYISMEDFGEIVYNFLIDFDRTLVDMDKYNFFWQFYILITYGPGFLVLFFGATVVAVFPSKLLSIDWTIQFTALILSAGLWTYSVLLAGHVSSNSKKLYKVLNRICLTKIESEIYIKLENMVKRFSGREIGFNCYHMFTVTHEFLYEVLLFTGTSYVLVIDSIIV